MMPCENLPRADAGTSLKLLSGTRVLDLTTSIAGPYATMLLSDFGAEVIKIERPGTGDDSRSFKPPVYGGHALWFLSVNRNKKSVTVDFSKAEGLAVLRRLIEASDVIVTNQLPRVQEKLGLDYKSVCAIRPDIIFVSITGFGLSGARSGQPCYDLIAEGYSGVMDLTGEPENGPQKVGTPAADLLAGTDAAMGCLAALLDRKTTGRGHLVEVSLVESMTRFMSPRIVSYLGSAEVPQRTGARDSVIAIYQVFATADEPITLALPNDGIWRRFCVAVNKSDWLHDVRFDDNSGRVSARQELVTDIQAILATQPRAYWLKTFAASQIPSGPINRIDQIAADPELIDRGLFYAIESDGEALPQVGLGIRVDDVSAGFERAPPELGADVDDVLHGLLLLDPAEIAKLRSLGVV